MSVDEVEEIEDDILVEENEDDYEEDQLEDEEASQAPEAPSDDAAEEELPAATLRKPSTLFKEGETSAPLPVQGFTQEEIEQLNDLAATNLPAVIAIISQRVAQAQFAANSAALNNPYLDEVTEDVASALRRSSLQYAEFLPMEERGTRDGHIFCVMAAIAEKAMETGDLYGTLKEVVKSNIETKRRRRSMQPPTPRLSSSGIPPSPSSRISAPAVSSRGRTSSNSPYQRLASSLGASDEDLQALRKFDRSRFNGS